jgi:hypothetical protein
MGLLSALDYFYNYGEEKSSEIEYRLLSWGEIYTPFLSDREHSIAAQFILREFPFKLFSISTAYSEIPQKLCLTFNAPLETKKIDFVTSHEINANEIAKEFAALLSLITRRRVFAIGQTRQDGFPLETSSQTYERSQTQETQQMVEINPHFFYDLLKKLQTMDRKLAESYMLAVRLYHSAIEQMYSEPEFSYIFLVMCIEAISSVRYENRELLNYKDKNSLEEYLNSRFRGWKEFCDITTTDKWLKVTEMLLSDAYFAMRKFRKFIIEYLPEKFWNEEIDDAKPDYLTGMVVPGVDGRGKEEYSHSNKKIQDYEMIDRLKLKRVLDQIYDSRSKLVHTGTRLSPSIVLGHYRRIPVEAFTPIMNQKMKNWKGINIPPLLTFERMVSYSLIGFLEKPDL